MRSLRLLALMGILLAGAFVAPLGYVPNVEALAATDLTWAIKDTGRAASNVDTTMARDSGSALVMAREASTGTNNNHAFGRTTDGWSSTTYTNVDSANGVGLSRPLALANPSDGTWISLAYHSQEYCIRSYKSTDNGGTWGSAVAAFDLSGGCSSGADIAGNVLTGTTTPNGRIIGAVPGVTSSAYFFTSTDQGDTYSQSAFTARHCLQPYIAAASNTQFHIVCFAGSPTRSLYHYVSTDAGDTWAETLLGTNTDGMRVHVAAEDTSNTLATVVNIVTGTLSSYRSTDGGSSWSAVGTLTANLRFGELLPLGNGIYVQGGPDIDTSGQIKYVLTDDHGSTWTKGTIQSTAPTTSDFQVGMAYECSSKTLYSAFMGASNKIQVASTTSASFGDCPVEAPSGPCPTEAAACSEDAFRVYPSSIRTDWTGDSVYSLESWVGGKDPDVPLLTRWKTSLGVRSQAETCYTGQQADQQVLNVLPSTVVATACGDTSATIWWYPADLRDTAENGTVGTREIWNVECGDDPTTARVPCHVKLTGPSELRLFEALAAQLTAYSDRQWDFWYDDSFTAGTWATSAFPSYPYDIAIDRHSRIAYVVTYDGGLRGYRAETGSLALRDDSISGQQVEAYKHKVYVGTPSGITGYTFSDNTLTPFTNTTTHTLEPAAYSFNFGAGMRLSRDGAYVVWWDDTNVALLNATNLTHVLWSSTTPDTITAADLDIGNNYLYVGTKGLVLARFDLFDYTTAWGADGGEGMLNPVPGAAGSPIQCTFTSTTSDFGAAQTCVPDTHSDDVTFSVRNPVSQPSGRSIFGVPFDDGAQAMGVGIGGFAWFLGLVLVVMIAVAAYAYTQSNLMGSLGAILGLGMAVAFGLIPPWFIILFVFAGALWMALRRSRGAVG